MPKFILPAILIAILLCLTGCSSETQRPSDPFEDEQFVYQFAKGFVYQLGVVTGSLKPDQGKMLAEDTEQLTEKSAEAFITLFDPEFLADAMYMYNVVQHDGKLGLNSRAIEDRFYPDISYNADDDVQILSRTAERITISALFKNSKFSSDDSKRYGKIIIKRQPGDTWAISLIEVE